VLIGFAFASIGMALTTFMRSFEDFEYVPAATLPLFLFSATFYPVSQYGEWGWVVQLSPLYHGVELIRAANLGEWRVELLAHIAVLVVITVVGSAIAARRIERLLLT
jgi:lipooligosaccharide transport system permease protein